MGSRLDLRPTVEMFAVESNSAEDLGAALVKLGRKLAFERGGAKIMMMIYRPEMGCVEVYFERVKEVIKRGR